MQEFLARKVLETSSLVVSAGKELVITEKLEKGYPRSKIIVVPPRTGLVTPVRSKKRLQAGKRPYLTL